MRSQTGWHNESAKSGNPCTTLLHYLRAHRAEPEPRLEPEQKKTNFHRTTGRATIGPSGAKLNGVQGETKSGMRQGSSGTRKRVAKGGAP